MLGITLAPASGQALADDVLTGRRPALLEPSACAASPEQAGLEGPGNPGNSCPLSL